MHSDKKRCADTLSLSRQAEQNRAEERVSIDTKKGSKYNKSNEKRGGGIQLKRENGNSASQAALSRCWASI